MSLAHRTFQLPQPSAAVHALPPHVSSHHFRAPPSSTQQLVAGRSLGICSSHNFSVRCNLAARRCSAAVVAGIPGVPLPPRNRAVLHLSRARTTATAAAPSPAASTGSTAAPPSHRKRQQRLHDGSFTRSSSPCSSLQSTSWSRHDSWGAPGGRSGGRCQSQQADSEAPADSIMLCGDALMLLATEFSSERMAPGHLNILAALLITGWLLVSQLKGDYKPAAYDVWSIEEPIIAALQSSAVTWAVVAPLVLGAFALLVCNGTLDAAGFTNSVSFTGPNFALLGGPDAVPEVEIVLAALWTVTAWRGFYAAFRIWSNFH